MRENIYSSIDELQADVDVWLKHYNEERPHRGYRNMGKRPGNGIRDLNPRRHPRIEPLSA